MRKIGAKVDSAGCRRGVVEYVTSKRERGVAELKKSVIRINSKIPLFYQAQKKGQQKENLFCLIGKGSTDYSRYATNEIQAGHYSGISPIKSKGIAKLSSGTQFICRNIYIYM